MRTRTRQDKGRGKGEKGGERLRDGYSKKDINV